MKEKQRLISRLMFYADKFKIHMVLSWFFSIISGVLTFTPYFCLFLVARELITSGPGIENLNGNLMVHYGWLAVMSTGMSFMCYGLSLLFSHIAAFNLIANLRIRMIDYLGRLPLGFHLMNPSGKLRKVIEKNTEDTENFVAHQLPDTVQAIVSPIVFLVASFLINWSLALVSMIPIVVGFVSLSLMLKTAKNGFLEQYQSSMEDMSNAGTEYVRGISVVKVFGQTVHSFKRFFNSIQDYKKFITQYSMSWKKPMGIYYTAIHGIFFALVPAGIILYQYTVSPESFITSFIFFIVLTPMVVTMLFRIMNCSSNKMITNNALDQIEGVLNEKTMEETCSPKQPGGFDIRFDSVSFSYAGASERAIDNLSFMVKEGSVTALVGPSGGGKTTIANLVARFWDVQSGGVFAGGINLRDMVYDEWIKNISFVFQDVSLFKMTVAENVALDRPEASMEEILNALNLAQCDDIIKKLPDGINTVIGTKDIFISGGEMQRISLARAILKDAPVILLDEATSFADAENEYKIQQALKVLTKEKTVIMIAHRLSTVTGADQILVIDNGRLMEKGTHNELMRKKGQYHRMYTEYQTGTSWKIGGEIYA